MSTERAALWARVDSASFLDRNEKRQAVGYGAIAATATPSLREGINRQEADIAVVDMADEAGVDEAEAEINKLKARLYDLEQKYPGQPRDHGRFSFGAGTQSYSPDKTNYHKYTSGPNLVCTAKNQCTKEKIADLMRRFSVPGQNPMKPVENGSTNEVHTNNGVRILVGEVETTISEDGLTVENRTLKGHWFHDGTVTRVAKMDKDGSWWVTSHGVGNNVTLGMNYANNIFGAGVFDSLDADMRKFIEEPPFWYLMQRDYEESLKP